MTEPMTPEGRARLMADVDRIRDLVEGQSLGALTVPDGRDMEALARVVRDVPDLAAELDTAREAAERDRDSHEEFAGELLGLLPPGTVDGGGTAYEQIPRGIRAMRADLDVLTVEVAALRAAHGRTPGETVEVPRG